MDDFNFKKIGQIDVDELCHNLSNVTEDEWQEHQIRQNKGETHAHTNTLEILWDYSSLISNTVGKEHPNYKKLKIDEFWKDNKRIWETEYGLGKALRMLITRLKPNTKIAPHKDSGRSLNLVKRTHIPLITNENILFTVGGETKYLRQGEVWEINNGKKIHSVENNSEEHRMHFIIDYLPDDLT